MGRSGDGKRNILWGWPYESGMDLRNEFAFSQWNFLLSFNLLMVLGTADIPDVILSVKVAGERRMADIPL